MITALICNIYILYILFEGILQISVKKNEKIFIKIIQYIIFEDLHINIGKKSPPTLFFDILCYTTIIYDLPRLGGNSPASEIDFDLRVIRNPA